MITKMTISWNVNQCAKMAANNKFRFDNIFQRSYVWEQARKSNLIHSLIEGFPIPPFYAKRVDGKIYDFLDGKQRLNSLVDYINNKYSLIGIPEITYQNDEGEEITEDFNGYKFEDLPEVIQDTIKSYTLTIYYFDDISFEQVQMLFAKLNNGKPLSTKENNIANCVDLINLTEIGKHELFDAILTQKAKESRKQIPIIMKMWVMLNEAIEDVSFASTDFNEVMKTTRISPEEKAELEKLLDRYLEIHNCLVDGKNKTTNKRVFAETHMVSLVPYIKDTIDEPVDTVVEKLARLFGGDVVVSERYMEACKGGSAKNINIRIRNDEIEKAIDEITYKELNETA